MTILNPSALTPTPYDPYGHGDGYSHEYDDGYSPGYDDVHSHELVEHHPFDPVPPNGPGGRAGGGYKRSEREPKRKRKRGKFGKLVRLLCLLVLLTLLAGAGTYVWAGSRLDGDVDLGAISQRAAPGKGTNYLIVGSDSREGLSDQQAKNLHTGSELGSEGRRTDSMMVLHSGAHGSTLTSLPRDSWVTIPGYVDPKTGVHHKPAKNKLNAAFSLGGPELLVRTIESNTGLRINHYTEIGFAGFVGIVDAVGGVPMCVDRHIVDDKSGLDLTKGCHNLTGREALGFVRQRHQEKNGDLGRSQNQQKFLSALAKKASSPGVLMNPSALYGTAGAGLDTLIVDKSTGVPQLTRLFKSMKAVTAGQGKQLGVPVGTMGLATSKGSAIVWDKKKAKLLFTELREDRPVTVKE
ncbi:MULTISPECIES: LCP family protein [unclassified Streptomyces]|uniref:LCP family protein n=1 Tax=unclassified Streptomyces TaxID=2593676 RepID=UPI00278BBC8E|nr:MULTISPECIES: LCP family protein [unclassified Streptomyces]